MTKEECQSIVHSFFDSLQDWDVWHLRERNLTFDGKTYPVRPDDTYTIGATIIAVEYENTKRPVESITKYWWLLILGGWPHGRVMLKCVYLPVRERSTRSRAEIVPLLGEELEERYPDTFAFYYLPSDEMTAENILQKLGTACNI